MKALLASLIMVILASGSAEAFARLTVCNDSASDTLRIAYLVQRDPDGGGSWQVSGWYEVKPSACQELLQQLGVWIFPEGKLTDVRLETFLVVRQKTPSGQQRIIHLELGPRQDYFKGAERFFCVQDKPFDRILANLNEHESCPSEWYEQLFNVYVYIPGHIDYKLHLGQK